MSTSVEARLITDLLKKYLELLIEDYDASFLHSSLLQGKLKLDEFKINCHNLNALNKEGAFTGIDVDGLELDVSVRHRQPFVSAKLKSLTLDLSDEPVLVHKACAREVALAFGKDPDAPDAPEPKKPYDLGARVGDSVELSIGNFTIRKLPPRSIMSDAQLKRHPDPQNLHRYVPPPPAPAAATARGGFVVPGPAPPLCVLTSGCGCICCPKAAHAGAGDRDGAPSAPPTATPGVATTQQPTGECPVDLSVWSKLPSPINVLVIELLDFTVRNIDATTHAPCDPEHSIVAVDDPPPTLRTAAAAAAAAATAGGAAPSSDAGVMRVSRRLSATLRLSKEDEDTGARLPVLAPLPITIALTMFKARATGDMLDVHVEATFDDTTGLALKPELPGAPVGRAHVTLGVAAAALASGLGTWFDGAESAIFAALAKEAAAPPPRGLVPSAKQAQSVPPTEPASDVPERPRSVTSECTDGNMCGMFAG